MRHFTLKSTGRRLVAAGTVVLATSSAACSDTVTAPEQTAAPIPADASHGSGIIIKNLFVTATVNIINVWGQTINEKAFVKFKTGTDSMNVLDNSPKDLDPATGVIKVTLVLGTSYTACAIGDTWTYQAEKNPQVYPNCSTGTVQSGKVDFGKVYMRRKPRATFITQDNSGAMLGGATVAVTLLNGVVNEVDDGEMFADQTGLVDGQIRVQLGTGPGQYTWCEVEAPLGYALTKPTCGTFTAYWEVDPVFYLKHKQL